MALDVYLAQAEMTAEIAGWTNQETAIRVALSLEDCTLQVLENLQPAERSDWVGNQQEAVYERLVIRVRRANEKLGKFAMNLQCLARHGYPTLEDIVHEELACCAFLQGLRTIRLHKHVQIVPGGCNQ